MKKLTVILSVLFLSTFFVAGSAMALSFGADDGERLQGVLDDITVGGDSSINVKTDELDDSTDSYWSITASGGSVATLIIELAGFANSNTFGVYSDGVYVELFDGSQGAGEQALLSIKADGSVWVNFDDTGFDFSGNNFGYYLDSTARVADGGGLFHSDTQINSDDVDHMAAYQGNDSDLVQLPNLQAGIWTDNEFILAWEDLEGGGDLDYEDFVVMVESVTPVPEPATMLLLGFGLIGIAGASRKKLFKK